MALFQYAESSMMYWLRVSQAFDIAAAEITPAALYRALELYYFNNGVYDLVQQQAYTHGLWTEGMKGFRNPAHRVVEFYVSHIWAGQLPDALQIISDNKNIVDPIHLLWKWSNWSAKKQLASRWLSLYGDLFTKIATRNDSDGNPSRVYLQLIKPIYVTDLEHDERDFLTYIRLDIPQTRKEGGRTQTYTHTEIWDKNTQMFTVWKHDRGADIPVDQLGDPFSFRPFDDFGIDFVPFVHTKFQDVGDERGIGAFVHSLDKIDEANRMATRLAQMLFRYNKALWTLSANGLDNTGRPLPPPRIGRANSGTAESDSISINDDTVIGLPGNSKLDSLVPNIQYDSALRILQDHLIELEKDLPELAYYRLRDMGANISGRAVRLMLSDAIDKTIEARGNAEDGLSRAHAMALTIGKNIRLPMFSNVGNYESGDFDHTFATRPVVPLTESEEAEVIAAETGAGIPLKTSLRRRGWSEEEIKQLEKDKEEEKKNSQDSFAQALLNSQRNFNRGQNPGNPTPDEQNSDE